MQVGCIVNDVASVNIDAKLIRGAAAPSATSQGHATTSDLADTIELANGCACCRWVGLLVSGGLVGWQGLAGCQC